MLTFTEAQIEDVKRRADIVKVAEDLGAKLRLSGGKHLGGCPACGGSAKSNRFKIENDLWACAACVAGGDVIALIRHVTGCSFAQAVERLGGTAVLSPQEEQELADRRRAIEQQRDAKNEAHRLKELNAALRLWGKSHVAGDIGLVRRYLKNRACGLPTSAQIREADDFDYYHGVTEGRNGEMLPRSIHHGPAMVAALVDNDGKVVGVHVTYLTRDGAAKVKLNDPDTGEMLPAKKMRGSKKGTHIVLRQGAVIHRLFISEGIETGLSVATALHKKDKLLPGDAFWAAGDLGNLGGPAAGNVLHTTAVDDKGHPRRIPGPEPHGEDRRVIAVPDTVHTLVLLGDGDSERELTLHALERAKRRYARPGRAIAVAVASDGQDFNDMLLGEEVAA